MTRILILIGLAALLMLGRFVLRSGSRRHRDPQNRPATAPQVDTTPVGTDNSDGGEISTAGPFPTGFVEVHVAGPHKGESLRAATVPLARYFGQPLLLSAAVEIPYQVPLSAFPTKELWDANWPELQDVQDMKRALLAKGFSVHTCLIRTRDRRRGPVYRSETSPYRVIITPWDRPTGMRSPGRALSVSEEARYRPQTPTIWVRGHLDPDRPAWVLVPPDRPLPTTGLLASVLQEVGGVSIRLVTPQLSGSAAATATNRLLRWADRHGLDRRYLTVGAPAEIIRFLVESADPSDLLILPASAKPLYRRMIHAPIGETLIQRYPGNLLLVEEAGPLLRSERSSPAIATG